MKPHYAGKSRRAPQFKLPNLDGKMVSLSDYRGKVVILNFWSKSCPPCLEEMPSLATLGHTLKGRDDISLVTITTDESAEDASATLKSILGEDAPFEVLVDPESSVVTELFGTKLYPETWFVDQQGIVRARVDGARDWSTALILDYAESLSAPLSCDLSFKNGQISGKNPGFCAELGM